MYKTKLRAWGIRKCNLEQTIEQGKDKGKPPKFSNKGSPFDKAGIDSHRRKKKKTLEELMKSTVIDAPMPGRFICVTLLPSDGDRYPFDK
jgi:hypothetical protein